MMNKMLSKEIDNKDNILPKEIVETFFGKSAKSEHTQIKKPYFKNNTAPIRVSFPPYMIALLSIFMLSGIFYISYLAANHYDGNIHKEPAVVGSSNYLKILDNGVFDRYYVKSFNFEGDAKDKSMILGNGIKLVNSGRMGWARASIVLKDGIFLNQGKMMVLARSLPGSRMVHIVLKDLYGHSFKMPIVISPKWGWKTVTVKNRRSVDISKVNSIALEFGTMTTGNDKATEIFIKEIGIRKIGF